VLNQSTQGIQLAIASLQSTSQEMIHLGEQVGNISKKSTQVLDVTEANQQSLGQIVAQLQQSAEIFHSVMKTIDALQKRMTTGGDRFVEVQGELTRLVDLLQVYTEQMNIGITKLGDRLVAALREETSPDRDRGQVVASRISKLGNDLNSVQAQLTELVESLNSPESAENTLIQPPTSSQEDNTNPFNPNLLNSEEDEK
jgi:chromosome segregation ATPase